MTGIFVGMNVSCSNKPIARKTGSCMEAISSPLKRAKRWTEQLEIRIEKIQGNSSAEQHMLLQTEITEVKIVNAKSGRFSNQL